MSGLLSNWLSKERTKKIIPYLEGAVLDIGCGNAKNLKALKDNKISFESYCGIESDKSFVEELGARYPKATFHQRDLDVEELKLGKKFDTIILLAVIEHIFNQKFLVEQLMKHLADKGKIIMTTPTVFGNDIVHRFGSEIGIFDKYGAHEDHIVIYNKKRFKHLARECGLKITCYQKFQLGCNQLVIFENSN